MNPIHEGLEKIRKDSRRLRDLWKLGLGGPIQVGFVFPAQANRILSTLNIINAVSILDHALNEYLTVCHPTAPNKKVNSLRKRILYPDRRGKLKDGSRLLAIKNDRNRYAHEQGQYGTWEEMDQLLSVV